MGSFITSSGMLSEKATYSAIKAADGKVKRPFVGRVLLPQFSNLVSALTPEVWQKTVSIAVRDMTELRIVKRTFGSYNKNLRLSDAFLTSGKSESDVMQAHNNLFRVVVMFIAAYLALLVYGVSLYSATRHFFPGRPWLACLTPVLGLLLFHAFSDHHAHIYDIPQLAFFSLLLLALHKEQWRCYFLLFFLACLNKETTLLILGVFVLHKWNERRTALFWKLVIWQLVIWAACYGLIYHVWFGDNRVWRYLPAINVIGFEVSGFNTAKMFKLMMGWFLLTSCWSEIPEFLKKALWLLPILIGLYLVFGFYQEYRVLLEAFPVVTLIIGYSLFSRLDTRLSARQT